MGNDSTTSSPFTRRRLLASGALVAAGVNGGCAMPSATRRGLTESLAPFEAACRTSVASSAMPGILAMATDSKGTIYQGAFGKRSLAGAAPMTRDTIFRIASMTKAITATAAMQLVERGKIRLDDPLPDFDAGLSKPMVLEGFDASGKPILRPARKTVTLRQLLTHTAGFTYTFWDADIARYAKVTGHSTSTGNKAALRIPLVFEPGSKWEYGVNYDWLGRVIEAVSGQPLQDYFKQNILAPLGMNDTGFVNTPEQRTRLAAWHQRGPDGVLEAKPLEGQSVPEFYSGGGPLLSTGPDYLRFLRMLLNRGALDGQRILRAETIADMGRNQIGDLPAGVLKTTNRANSEDVDFFPGQPIRWGLGFMLNMQAGPDGRSAGTLSWGGFFNTYYWLDAKRDVAGVFMTQILPFADKPTVKLYQQFERGIYAGLQGA